MTNSDDPPAAGNPAAAGVPPTPGTPVVTEMTSQRSVFLRSQYESLRAEVIKRLETRTQLVSIALVAFAALLSIGVQFHNADVVLIYPPLALFLSASWLAEERAIRTIAGFIRNVIEGSLDVVGWEHFIDTVRSSRKGYLLAIRGVFITSEILATSISLVIIKPLHEIAAVLHGAPVTTLLTAEYAALGVAILSIVLTTIQLSYRIDALVPKDGAYAIFIKNAYEKAAGNANVSPQA